MIQVERLLETYQSTLRLQHKGQLELAKRKYEELVSHHLVKKEPKPVRRSTLPARIHIGRILTC